MTPGDPAFDKTVTAASTVSPDADRASVETVLRTTRVHVVVSAPGPERLVQARTLLNLLARTFQHVSVDGLDPAQLFVASHAVKFRRGTGDGLPDVVVALTDDPIAHAGAASTIYVDNRGWTAYLSTIGPWPVVRVAENRVAAVYAGARAAGEVFNRAFARYLPRAQLLDGTHTFDMATLRADAVPNYVPDIATTTVALPDTGIVGVGAVGQALVDALAEVPHLQGLVRLIDHETTDASNESRYVLSFPENRGQLKVVIGTERLRRALPFLRVRPNVPLPITADAQLTVNLRTGALPTSAQLVFPQVLLPIRTDYEAFQRVVGYGNPMPFVVAAVDSEQVRRDIQMGLHRVILNGWTHTAPGRMDYSIGRHMLNGPLACLACIYHEERPDEVREVELAASITGWSREEVRRRLVDAADAPTSREEVEALFARRGATPADRSGLYGRPLRDVLHDQCGLATLGVEGRDAVAPAAHVPVLVGALLAAQVVHEALGLPTVTNTVVYDSFRLPVSDTSVARQKVAGCLCADSDVQAVYAERWRH